MITFIWCAFGRGKAEFVGYWAAEPWLAASPTTIKASVYVHPAPAWLVVVSNLGEKVTTARLAFSEKLPANLTAVNALDGQPLPIEGRSLSLSLPALGYQVIEVRPSG